MFQLKTEFEKPEDAIAHLQNEVKPELERLQRVEEDEKPALLRKRDELLGELKTAKGKATEAEARATELEAKNGDLEQRLKGQPSQDDIEARYRTLYEQDQAKFNERLQAIEKERAQEKADAEADRLKASVMGELSKPNHNIINPDHFFKLHGDRIALDETTGELYIDAGDYKRQSVQQYVEDVAQRPEEQHLFKPKTGKGNDSPGSGDPLPAGAPANPWKADSFNLTEQGRILRSNPALATRLKKEAGK